MPTSISVFERRRRNLLLLLESKYRGSQADLARAISRSPSYVWRLLATADSGHHKRLGEDLARLIERAVGVPDFWLDQDHGQAQKLLADPGIAKQSDVDLQPPRMSGPRAIPIYHWDTLDVRALPHPRGTVAGFVYTDTELGPATFAVIAKGDAMAPDVSQGDKVFVDPDVTPRAGDIVLAAAGSAVVLRQFRPTDDGTATFELFATNPRYAPISSDRAECRVLGVVVEHHRYRSR
jgi:hypothetical protein